MYKVKISKKRTQNSHRSRNRIISLDSDQNNPSSNTQTINSGVHNKSPNRIQPNTNHLLGTIYYYNTYFDN